MNPQTVFFIHEFLYAKNECTVGITGSVCPYGQGNTHSIRKTEFGMQLEFAPLLPLISKCKDKTSVVMAPTSWPFLLQFWEDYPFPHTHTAVLFFFFKVLDVSYLDRKFERDETTMGGKSAGTVPVSSPHPKALTEQNSQLQFLSPHYSLQQPSHLMSFGTNLWGGRKGHF